MHTVVTPWCSPFWDYVTFTRRAASSLPLFILCTIFSGQIINAHESDIWHAEQPPGSVISRSPHGPLLLSATHLLWIIRHLAYKHTNKQASTWRISRAGHSWYVITVETALIIWPTVVGQLLLWLIPTSCLGFSHTVFSSESRHSKYHNSSLPVRHVRWEEWL